MEEFQRYPAMTGALQDDALHNYKQCRETISSAATKPQTEDEEEEEEPQTEKKEEEASPQRSTFLKNPCTQLLGLFSHRTT